MAHSPALQKAIDEFEAAKVHLRNCEQDFQRNFGTVDADLANAQRDDASTSAALKNADSQLQQGKDAVSHARWYEKQQAALKLIGLQAQDNDAKAAEARSGATLHMIEAEHNSAGYQASRAAIAAAQQQVDRAAKNVQAVEAAEAASNTTNARGQAQH